MRFLPLQLGNENPPPVLLPEARPCCLNNPYDQELLTNSLCNLS